MSLGQIKQQRKDKMSELFIQCGVFYAFSDKQFFENKTPLKENEKYVPLGAGGYIPKGNVGAYVLGSKQIDLWYKGEVNQSKEIRRASIAYELSNHEAYYTGDIEQALDALGSDYSPQEVLNVYNEERTKVQIA